MLGFGEDPAVAAGHRAELESDVVGPAPAGVLRGCLTARGVAFEGDGGAQARQAERAAADAVRAVGGDHDAGGQQIAAGGAHCNLAVEPDAAHCVAVAQLRTGGAGLLGQKGVEPRALGHHGQRLVVAVAEFGVAAVAHAKAANFLLNDR